MRKSLEVSRENRTPAWNMPSVNEMFDRMWTDPFSMLESVRPSMLAEEGVFDPSFDVDETDQAYLLSVDLPGVKKEDVKIDLSDNVLTISGERKHEHESNKKGNRRFERSYGQFQRSVTLPLTIDADRVEASIEDGVLRIAIPKSEQSNRRAIEIQAGKPGLFAKLIGKGKEDSSSKTQESKQKTH